MELMPACGDQDQKATQINDGRWRGGSVFIAEFFGRYRTTMPNFVMELIYLNPLNPPIKSAGEEKENFIVKELVNKERGIKTIIS